MSRLLWTAELPAPAHCTVSSWDGPPRSEPAETRVFSVVPERAGGTRCPLSDAFDDGLCWFHLVGPA